MSKIIQGDTLTELKNLPDESVDCVITSPPYYGLRDYDIEGQIGREKTLEEYLEKMLAITKELKRVLKKTGTMWWNHGDSYAGSNCGSGDYRETDGLGLKPQERYKGQKPGKQNVPSKSLLMQNYRLAIRMTDEQGWIPRNTIIWHKPNCMPSSAKDRFTVDYEPVFFFTKAKKYYFKTQYEPHAESSIKARGARLNQTTHSGASKSAVNVQMGDEPRGNRFIPEQGRNKRCVWQIPTRPFSEAHFAVFPEELVEPMIQAGCPKDGIVIDPFFGAGTVGLVAKKLNRNSIGIELNEEYIKIAQKRINSIPETLL